MKETGFARVKKLVKNTMLYFLGNFASKLLNIVLIPIYMVYLEADSYGGIDMLLLLSSIVALLFSLDMTDAVYRFMLDTRKKSEADKIATVAVLTYCFGLLIFSLIYFPVAGRLGLKNANLLGLHILVANFAQLLLQICRGLKQNLHYALAGIILTLIQGISNIILIVHYSYGAKSILMAPVIGSSVVIIYMTIVTKWHKYIKLRCFDINVFKKMVAYSMPLFLQVIMLWIIQNSGTYFLTYFSGSTAASGVYGIANKFSALVNMLSSIFVLAWQESAIMEMHKKDADDFYRYIYSKYAWTLLWAIIVCLPLLRMYFMYVGNESYKDVWIYVPILLSGAFINALATFIGTQFIVSQNTMQMVKTLLPSVLIVLLADMMLVPYAMIYAVAFSQVLAYFVALLLRKKTTENIYRLSLLGKKQLLIYAAALITCACCIIGNVIVLSVVFIGLLCFSMFLGKDLIGYMAECIKKLLFRAGGANKP